MIFYDGQGRRIELGEVVGKGGEATVYRVVSQTSQLAKIYEPEPRPNYAGKLGWMVQHTPENPTEHLAHASLAWPDGLLFDSRRRLKGYSMPYIQQTAPLLEVFNPRRRARLLPQFNRRYLTRTARNLAAALSALHRSGYVAGDLNESNVLVTPTALVTLIDTDSFQVREEKNGIPIVHSCPVGKPEYTPPELQGKSLSDIIRHPDHDAFALAVLVFQLLMEGSHPFRAQWLAAGDPPPLEVRIANGAYPYVTAPAYPVLPPQNALGIETLHPWLVELFKRTFVDGHRDPRWRPGPDLWVRALDEAERSLIYCAQGHFYSSHLGTCPYCSLSEKRNAQAKNARSNRRPQANRAGRRASPFRSAGSYTNPRPAAATAAAAPPKATIGAASANLGNTGPVAAGFGFGRPGTAGGGRSPAGRQNIGVSSPSLSANLLNGVLRMALNNAPGVAAKVAGVSSLGSGSFFGFPSSGMSNVGVLRSRPIVPPGAMKNWLRQRAYKSLAVGGVQGALVGALPGALIGMINWSTGDALAWSLLFSIGGAAGGLLRGWKPGHQLAAVIDRTIGWKIFWQTLGLLTGIVIGGLIGLLFIWAVFPFILGLVFGGQLGLYVGRKLWQVGSSVGWERIWGVISGLGFGALGFGLARLLGVLGANALGLNLADGLLPFANNGSLLWALAWILAGGLGSALAGALAGLLTDILGRFTGLVN